MQHKKSSLGGLSAAAMMRPMIASLLASVSVVDGTALLWGRQPVDLHAPRGPASLQAAAPAAAAAAMAGEGALAKVKERDPHVPAKERDLHVPAKKREPHVLAKKRDPDVLVITVPGRKQSEQRMQRLAPLLRSFNLTFDVVDGPNMELYCPPDINDVAESKGAGRQLLLKEWHGHLPALSTYDLQLFQIATLVGHMRAWQRVADTGKAAVILEDDATVTSGKDLKLDVRDAGMRSADVSLLDPRHCQAQRPPHLSQTASGMTGYWIDAKAAQAFLAHFPINVPIDWGVNEVLNNDVVAVCSHHGAVKEYGGDRFARRHSSYHSCGRTVLLETAHVVSSFLEAHVARTRGAQVRAEESPAAAL